MLRIVDYAKGKDIEWYEVIRQAINESSVAPSREPTLTVVHALQVLPLQPLATIPSL